VASIFLAQRRKDAKKTSENAAALCVFAPLREKYAWQKTLLVKTRAELSTLWPDQCRAQRETKAPTSRRTPNRRPLIRNLITFSFDLIAVAGHNSRTH
jgi:hypothetical protein